MGYLYSRENPSVHARKSGQRFRKFVSRTATGMMIRERISWWLQGISDSDQQEDLVSYRRSQSSATASVPVLVVDYNWDTIPGALTSTAAGLIQSMVAGFESTGLVVKNWNAETTGPTNQNEYTSAPLSTATDTSTRALLSTATSKWHQQVPTCTSIYRIRLWFTSCCL